MTRFLTATVAAVALLGAGAAFAQDTSMQTPTPAPQSMTPAPADQSMTAPAQADPSATTAPTATPDAAAPAASAAPATADGATVVGDMSQANPPPASGAYPICKSHKQDRCVVASQAKHKG